jgi:hypothetical protein
VRRWRGNEHHRAWDARRWWCLTYCS